MIELHFIYLNDQNYYQPGTKIIWFWIFNCLLLKFWQVQAFLKIIFILIGENNYLRAVRKFSELWESSQSESFIKLSNTIDSKIEISTCCIDFETDILLKYWKAIYMFFFFGQFFTMWPLCGGWLPWRGDIEESKAFYQNQNILLNSLSYNY